MNEAEKLEISKSFRVVMEEQVFMIAEPSSFEDADDTARPFLGCHMTFAGARKGRVLLAVPEDIVDEVAANFLGLDAGDPRATAMAGDAFGELLNVVCGHLLTALFGDSAFSLTFPAVTRLESGQLEALAAHPDTLSFLADDSPVLLHVELEEASAETEKEDAHLP